MALHAYRRITLNFVGVASVLDDPAASPATASADGIPPVLFLDAEADTLRASSELYAERLSAEGVPVTTAVVDGSAHGFLNRPRSKPYQEGLAVVKDWLDGLAR